MVSILRKELQTYEAKKAELIGKYQGKFALIKDTDVLGVFDTKLDAIWRRYAHFGRVPFLVKHIVVVETPQHFTSNLLGV